MSSPEKQTCPTCKGEGMTRDLYQRTPPRERIKPCETCRGTGQVSSKCPDCGDTWKLPYYPGDCKNPFHGITKNELDKHVDNLVEDYGEALKELATPAEPNVNETPQTVDIGKGDVNKPPTPSGEPKHTVQVTGYCGSCRGYAPFDSAHPAEPQLRGETPELERFKGQTPAQPLPSEPDDLKSATQKFIESQVDLDPAINKLIQDNMSELMSDDESLPSSPSEATELEREIERSINPTDPLMPQLAKFVQQRAVEARIEELEDLRAWSIKQPGYDLLLNRYINDRRANLKKGQSR